MEKVQQWLNSGADYKKGVELYKNTVGHSKMLLRQLMHRENAYRKEKLIYELKKLHRVTAKALPTKLTHQPTCISTPVSKPSKQVPVLQTAEKENKRVAPLFHELPSELRPVLLEANNLFKENCLLKAELNDLPIDAETKALQLQHQITRNFKANEVCWDKIEYWRKHKQLPKDTSVKAISSYTMDQLIKKQALLNSSVSRMEKRLNENKLKLETEENPTQRNKILRKITKQEKEIIQKREEQLIIKTTIDVKFTSI